MPQKPKRFTLVYLGLLTIFLFLSISSADVRNPQEDSAAKIQCVWRNVDRIVVVGDLHGAYENFVKILKETGLVNETLQWTGGKTHLVQIGDILDRGDRARDIFDLLKRLEVEAQSAGGFVHVLIGNHEEMNLADTAFDVDGYITSKQLISFVSEKYVKKQERIFRRKKKKMQRKSLSSDYDISLHWSQVIENGKNNKTHVGRRNYFRNLNREYGRWILNHNLVVKINDMIFNHAGIIELYSKMRLDEMNMLYRMELGAVRTAILNERMPSIPVYKMRFYNNPNGPLWSRDFVRNDPKDFKDDIDRILFNLDASHMFIGHSPLFLFGLKGMKLYDGKIWVVDTGISDYYLDRGGFIGALIIERGKISVWTEK